MDAALPVLYSFRRCPYAMRARLALAVSGQTYQLREVVLRNKPAALLAASPKATVPVLVLPDGAVIDQSLDIMRWALQRHDPAQWLSPPRASLQEMLDLIDANDQTFKFHLDRYKYPNRYADESAGDTPAFALAHRTQAASWLHELNNRLSQGWLFGQRASLPDMASLPFIRQFAHTDPAWFAAQPWPDMQRWLAAFESSSLYAQVMQKHAPYEHSGL
ncbi:MAG: glutathione S-transferase [Polaromonas sp.]|jgi:glutathione S-transferase|nr:glutathione S-transferase [Polaromonas sp.]